MTTWRCQCPHQCNDGDSCWDDVTQEDFLCDHCRVSCKSALVDGDPNQ